MGEDYAGSRSLIRRALQIGGVPDASLDICMASITSGTIRQYNSGLKFWWEFCKRENKNIFSVSVPDVLKFLTLYYNKGASYGTLNSYRCAIAQIAGLDFANDFRLKRFFKGVFNLRPNEPKYSTTWDPSIVLNYIKTFPKNISLQNLTYKLAALLALSTGQRVQTLASIEIGNIVIANDGISIKIPKRLKTSGLNRKQPTLVLPFFKTDPSVCVAKCLIQYLKETRKLRDPHCNSLFITFKRPFRNAKPNSISRWIREVLKNSGLDTSIFTAHSTRHAATSAAARKGVSMDVIRLAAGWTEKSKTFANFYQRPLIRKSSFAEAVLGS
nr:site-specific integrase [Rickettsia endosymbiont of Ceutorhynchus assimilis]